MIYHILTISLIGVECLLIIVSLNYLKKIQMIKQDLLTTIVKDKNDSLPMFQELKELIALTSQKENYFLNIVFHLEEIKVYTKLILNEVKKLNQVEISNTPDNY